MMKTILGPVIAVVAFGMVLMAPARGESLKESLAAAYIVNPQLKAQRAQLRATDEEVSRAKSGYRPTVQGEAVHSYEDVSSDPPSPGDGDSYPRRYSINLSQPLFRGFRTMNAVEAAKAGVEAARENLRAVAQQVLLDAVTQYMNVLRDQAIVRLRQNDVDVLTEQLQATKDRFEVGEVTKTDVAQARAARASAVSALNLAKANLKSSRAAYERVVGYPPRNLRTPKPIDQMLPSTLEGALKIGERRNPSILAALFRVKAAQFDTKVVKGELLPELTLEARYEKSFDVGVDETDRTTVTGRLTVPIYQAGEVSARIRQSQDTQLQRRQEVDQARQQVRSDIVSAWGQLVAARAALVSDRAQVQANRIALEGVRAEEKVGQRTILDILDEQQRLLNSEVSLATTRRDLVVASYTLLSAIGRLTPSDLKLPTETYDPDKHYRDVKDQAFGFHWTTSVLPVEDTVVVGGDAELEPGGETVEKASGDDETLWVVPDSADGSLK
jgi:outer membrane protein